MLVLWEHLRISLLLLKLRNALDEIVRFVRRNNVVQRSFRVKIWWHVVVVLFVRHLVLVVHVLEIYIIVVWVRKRSLRRFLVIWIFNVIQLVVLDVKFSIVFRPVFFPSFFFHNCLFQWRRIVLLFVREFIALNFGFFRFGKLLVQRFVCWQISRKNVDNVLLEWNWRVKQRKVRNLLTMVLQKLMGRWHLFLRRMAQSSHICGN